MIPVMYGDSQMCAATVVLYTTCILLPLRQIKHTLLATLFSILFGYNYYDADAGGHNNGALVIDSLVEASRVSTANPFSSSCNYDDEDRRVVSTMKRLLLAATYEQRQSSPEEEEVSCCSICLGELAVEEGNKVCRLRRCNHMFHMDCIDKWVERGHYTCPLCRTSMFCSLP